MSYDRKKLSLGTLVLIIITIVLIWLAAKYLSIYWAILLAFLIFLIFLGSKIKGSKVKEIRKLIELVALTRLAALAEKARIENPNPRQEIKYLNECIKIIEADELWLTESPQLVYSIYMNRGNAALKLDDYILQEKSYELASKVAYNPQIKCKCLAYLSWAILYQRDKSKLNLVESNIKDFEECSPLDINSILKSMIIAAKAFLELYRNNLNEARKLAYQAHRTSDKCSTANDLWVILQQEDITCSEAINYFFEKFNNRNKQNKQKNNQKLSPLEDILGGEI